MKLEDIKAGMKVKVKVGDFTSQYFISFGRIKNTCGNVITVSNIVDYGINKVLCANGLFYHEEQLEEAL